jgi:hypothetical protein
MKSLSWKAKGLHTYLMSLPDDWTVRLSDLRTRSSDRKEATRSALRELEKAGFINRRRQRGEGGRMAGWDYTVYEVPPNETPKAGIPSTESPTTGNSDSTKEPEETSNQITDIPVDRSEEEGKVPVATAPGNLLSSLSEKTCIRSGGKSDIQPGSVKEGCMPVRKDDARNRLIADLKKEFSDAAVEIEDHLDMDGQPTHTLLLKIIPDLEDPQANMFYKMPVKDLQKQVAGALDRLKTSICNTRKTIRSPGGYLNSAMKHNQNELLKWANQYEIKKQEDKPC